MKFGFNRSVLIKLAIILAIFLIAPFAIPFSVEFVLMADIVGLEALILFLLFQSKQMIMPLLAKLDEWKNHVGVTVLLLLGLYFMQPDIFFAHALGSTVLLMFTCSVALAFAFWLPSLYLSLGSESHCYLTIKSIKDAAHDVHY